MSKLNPGVYTSNSPEWGTPHSLFGFLHSKHQFTLDVCALPHNAKCPKFFDPAANGLIQDWGGQVCWMNPPYGKEIGLWVAKAAQESQKPSTKIVALLPARTDTKWFHDHVLPFAQIEFLKGRLKFTLPGQTLGPAPFPSLIAIYQ